MALFSRLVDKFQRKTMPGDVYARKRGVKVGQNCRILSNSFSEPFLIEIGDHVTVSTNVQLITHDGSSWLFRDENGRRFDYRPISIGSHVFIGANVIVLPGVKIGNRVIVGAGSVVTKSIPSGMVVAGNPARFICDFDMLEERSLENLATESELGTDRVKSAILKITRQTFRPNLSR